MTADLVYAILKNKIGTGSAGDMVKSVYDTQNKAIDIFQYVDEKVASNEALQFSVEGVVVDD